MSSAYPSIDDAAVDNDDLCLAYNSDGCGKGDDSVCIELVRLLLRDAAAAASADPS